MKQRTSLPPLMAGKSYGEPSVFAPEHLLREARRQKRLRKRSVPGVCVFDPDGDIVRHLKRAGTAARDESWACYHTELYTFADRGRMYGIVGLAVGAPFAVLVAEELFASGCRFLMGMTSAGQITDIRQPPYFVLIDRALRDEGTSYHYARPSRWSTADKRLANGAYAGLSSLGIPVEIGASWTTDAPFRETAAAVAASHALGILTVEMEAAALYAFARARKRAVLCFAHVTNRMGHAGRDFEKGAGGGADDALRVIASARRSWERLRRT